MQNAEVTQVAVTIIKCGHCDYTWQPRYTPKPKACPNCKYRLKWEKIGEAPAPPQPVSTPNLHLEEAKPVE